MQDLTKEIEKCLEDVLAEQMSKQIAEEIDSSLMIDMLKLQGWQLVELESLGSRKRSIDIKVWIEKNLNGKHYSYGRRFVFEDSKDAVIFAMVWV